MGTGIPEAKRGRLVLWQHYTYTFRFYMYTYRDPLLFVWKRVGFLLFGSLNNVEKL